MAQAGLREGPCLNLCVYVVCLLLFLPPQGFSVCETAGLSFCFNFSVLTLTHIHATLINVTKKKKLKSFLYLYIVVLDSDQLTLFIPSSSGL